MPDLAAEQGRPLVLAVHCVDTEGPLEEPIEATFDRINNRFGLDLEPSLALLRQLQSGQVDLAGAEDEVARFIAPRRLAYLSLWREIEESTLAATAPDFRNRLADPAGRPYAYTWFIIDVVGYRDNPRRKAEGFHVVWDFYQRVLRGRAPNDAFGFHFHTVAPGAHALDYNTCWTNNDLPEQVLCRRILERGWFPSLFRAGGNIQRNDLSYWLEQFIPYDFSSCAQGPGQGRPGSEEDWRGAPADWSWYHPDFHDYRRPGSMNRSVFRCLPAENKNGYFDPADAQAAFDHARKSGLAVLAYSNHDRREMKPDVEYMHRLLTETGRKFPDVGWRWANALEAAQTALKLANRAAPVITLKKQGDHILISSDQPIFGPAPFLAVEEQGPLFYRDNPTRETDTTWAYKLRHPQNTRRAGTAASNASGRTGVGVMNIGETF